MSALSTILAAVLGVAFLAAGIPKLTGEERLVASFRRWGYADVIRRAVGWLEVIAATCLLAGIAVPALAVTGAMILVPVMVGALATHQRAGDPLAAWIPPAALLALDLVLAYSLLP